MQRPAINQANAARTRRVRKSHLWWLLLAIMAAYLSSLPGDFIWRDHQDIEAGALRLTSSNDWPLLWTRSSDQYRDRLEGLPGEQASGGWQPLLVLNYSLDWLLWQDCTSCYRLENILWHLLTAIGLYTLGRHLLYHRRHGKRTAFWAATAFALHPLAVSVVGWAGGRADLLFAACAVWALVAFTRLPAATASDHSRSHNRVWIFLSGFLTGLALLASPSALVILPSTILLGWFSLRERGRRRFGSLSVARRGAMLLIAAVSLSYLYYRYSLIGFDSTASYPGDGLMDTAGTLINLFWHYCGLVFIPGEPLLSDSWPITPLDPALVAALFGLLFLLAAIAVGLRLNNPIAFGAAWFVLWLLPGSGLFPLTHVYAENQLYPASWGLLFASAYLLVQLWRPLGRQLAPGSEAIALIPVLLVLATLTGLSNARWWNDDSLFQTEVDIDPYYLDGRIALAELALADNRPLDATPHLLTALDGSKKPQFTGHWQAARAYTDLSQAQLQLALYTDAKQYAEKAVELAPNRALPWYLLGSSELGLERTKESIAALRMASERQPANARIQARLGAALIKAGQMDEGLTLLTPHAEIADIMELEIMAGAELEIGRHASAIRHLERALRLEEEPKRRAQLAWARWQSGDKQAARDDLRLAMDTATPAPEYIEWVATQMGEDKTQLRLNALLEGLEPTAAGSAEKQP